MSSLVCERAVQGQESTLAVSVNICVIMSVCLVIDAQHAIALEQKTAVLSHMFASLYKYEEGRKNKEMSKNKTRHRQLRKQTSLKTLDFGTSQA